MKQQTFKKAGQLISLCIKPYKNQFIWPIVFTSVGSILGGLGPFVIGLAITELGKNVQDMAKGLPGAGVNFKYILFVIALLSVSAIARQGLTYLASFILAGGVQHSIKDLRTRISQKMNTLPVSYFDSHQHGTILNTITNDVDAITGAVQQSLLSMVYSITSIIITFVMMIYISVPLGIASLLMVPAAFYISQFIMKKSQKGFLEMQNTQAELNGYIQERYTGFTVIKLFNNEDVTIDRFNEVNERMNRIAFKANFTSSLLSPLMELLVNITYVVMILLTGYAVIFSGMTLGNMQAFVQYIWIIYDPMSQITQLSPAIQSAAASMERIVNFLEETEEDQESGKISTLELEKYPGGVTFENVQFSYTKKKPLIKDFTLAAKPGQKIAIVGATGAGKTTIINLLMRFYDIDAGDIAIDGNSIYSMNRNAVRTLFGMVLQDAWLYHATIADNIRYGRLDATDEEVVQAAKDANVHHFIKTMPGGYNMMINEEGSNVSLGQKQLLTIARALLANPRILILDEATSSVDTRLEMLIQVAMRTAMEGRTSFVIAHRLSTIKDADLILVMEAGNIVEQGTHNQLLAQKGVYEKLYNSQFAEE
ncbi:MAG: ABC transporter ATP-binding protein [Lachnospiraceae bacterium]